VQFNGPYEYISTFRVVWICEIVNEYIINVFHVRAGHTDEWATKTPKLIITTTTLPPPYIMTLIRS
jgi:hypothetical protein